MDNNKTKEAVERFYANKPLRFIIAIVAFIILSIFYTTFDFPMPIFYLVVFIIIFTMPSIFPLRRKK